MGYFSNGTEGIDYQERYCIECINYTTRDGEGAEGCPVWDMHLIHNYEQCTNKTINDLLCELIPQDGIHNERCKMFLSKEPKPVIDDCWKMKE